MSKGYSGLFTGTKGNPVPGNISFMLTNDIFHRYIGRRSDVDSGGYFDIVAHGSSKTIEINHNGKTVEIDHRVAAKLFRNNSKIPNKPLRLLSCSTGMIDHGFAQGLADRLGVPVKAPSDFLWANPNGTYFVAGYKENRNGEKEPDKTKPGKFIVFYPHKRRGKNDL